MSEPIVAGLGDVFERFDGKGHPHGKQGEESELLARVVVAADVLEIAFSRYGLAGALATARKRSGGQFDPGLVATFCDDGPDLLDGLAAASVWEAFLDAEPAPHQNVTPAVVARYAEAFARAIDLKSVWTATHSHSVGVLAASAGEAAGLPRSVVEDSRIAGWLHDLGRVAVPNLIWDKPGPLNDAEWEQMRLHAYHTERLLARSPVLASVAALAGAAHERCDGSGYIKALRSGQLDTPARLLAACDVYCALREDRPHRPAFSTDAATGCSPRKRAGHPRSRRRPICPRRRRRGARYPSRELARRPDRPRGRSTPPRRPRRHQQGRRPSARHLPPHRPAPRLARLHQDRRDQPGRGRTVRSRTRPCHTQPGRATPYRRDGRCARRHPVGARWGHDQQPHHCLRFLATCPHAVAADRRSLLRAAVRGDGVHTGADPNLRSRRRPRLGRRG